MYRPTCLCCVRSGVIAKLTFVVAIAVALIGSILLGQGQPAGANEPAPVIDNDLLVGHLYLRAGDINTADLPSLLDPNSQLDSTRHYVVQFDGPMTLARFDAIQQAGMIIGDYLPAYAWTAHVNPAMNLNKPALIQAGAIWLGEYQNAWKIDPDIGQHNFTTPERQQLAAQGIVMLEVSVFENEVVEEVAAAINAVAGAAVAPRGGAAAPLNGVQISGVAQLPASPGTPGVPAKSIIALTMPLNLVPQLANIKGVQYVEEFGEYTLRNDSTRWIVQSNSSGFVPFYNAGIRGENQVIGHIDGAINISHCSFRDTVNPVGPLHRKIISLNGTGGYDPHGTHTAGTAAGDNFTDFGNTRGVAYMAKITHSGFPAGETGSYNSFTNMHNQGGRLHTNSWGNDGTTVYDGLCRGIDRFQRDNEDSLVLFAVTNQSTLRNPENAKNLVAVGASQDTPSQSNFCFGGAGPTNDGRRKPEVYAPGCNTTSSNGSGTVCGIANMSGTSMACPAVSGLGALMRQYYTAGYYPTGSAVPGNAFLPTAALVKSTLINGAVDMTGIAGYPSNTEGWGRALGDEAVFFPGNTRTMLVYDVRNNVGLTTGQQTDRGFSVSSSAEKLKVTLVWTEPAASVGANPAYTNNLNLQVIGPGGTYLGNVFSGGVSVTGGVADGVNNVEQVHIINPPIGSYTVRVIGTGVNVGPQGYALVISGVVNAGPPVPVNDLCANATTATGNGSTAFTNVGAGTDGPDEPGACTVGGYSQIGSDVWLKFVAACTGTTTVSLCGATYNTKMAVYGPCPSGSGQYLACNDDFCETSSQVSFPTNAGTVYRVRIGGFGGATGSGTMSISCITAPPPCAPDVTGDGQVNVNDLLAVINAWGPCPGCAADITGDGQVNVNDLLAVINAWGPCP